MSKPLSLSAYNRWSTCPAMYRLHYIDRIRPTVTPSHLIFGSAIDAGLNALILESGSPMVACETELKRLVTEGVEFFKADYDGEIIDEKTKAALLEKSKSLGYSGDDVDGLVGSLLMRPRNELSANQRKVLALACAASLKAKAVLMIDSYRDRVLPLIKRTVSVQKELTWTDAAGNEFVGVLDLVAEFAGEGVVVIDNKTASRPYDQSAVSTSAQLGLYANVEGVSRAAYVVLEKNIRKNRIKTCSVCGNVSSGRAKTCDAGTKRCGGEWAETIRPEVNVQILVGEAPRAEGHLVIKAMSEVAEAIKLGVFPPNLQACANQYGKPCAYRGYCRTGDMTGLEVKPEGDR